MSLFQRLTAPLSEVAYAVFKQDVRLSRDEGRLRVVLDEPKGSTRVRPPSQKEIKARRRAHESALMREQLAALLGGMPEARSTMRHLVIVEQAITKKGADAINKLPLEVLEKALSQLERLVSNWSPVGLAALRSKMAVAIIDREDMDADAEADAYRTSAMLEGVAEVDAAPSAEAASDEQALAAAYASLGVAAPAEVTHQGELGRRSTQELARRSALQQMRSEPGLPGLEIRLLEAHD